MTVNHDWTPASDLDDAFAWLEEITGERALQWVKARNAESLEALSGSEAFVELEQRLLAIVNGHGARPRRAQ